MRMIFLMYVFLIVHDLGLCGNENINSTQTSKKSFKKRRQKVVLRYIIQLAFPV